MNLIIHGYSNKKQLKNQEKKLTGLSVHEQ